MLSTCEIAMIQQTFHKIYTNDTLLHFCEYKNCFYPFHNHNLLVCY